LKILFSNLILTPDIILYDKAIAFDKKIKDIDDLETLKARYPQAEVLIYENSILLPTFANPHVHLEFSANRTTLSYGDFLTWLYSVISFREELLLKCNQSCLEETLSTLIEYGTTAIGEISSYGDDLVACANSKLKVVFFNEVIGANPATVDISFASFLERFKESQEFKSERFKPAVAIHSPYSVHYVLAKKALNVAKSEGCLVSVHFMESLAEREWLDKGTGEFAKFFKQFLNQTRPINDPLEFLELFEDVPTLFVHMVYANKREWEKVKDSTIIHCPISNRVLGNGVLDLSKPKHYLIATDGLSSNYSLNMFEELKATLFVHPHYPILPFAKELIVKATKEAHKVLGFEAGEIVKGKLADFQIISFEEGIEHFKKKEEMEIYLQLLLHTSKPKAVFIEGENFLERRK